MRGPWYITRSAVEDWCRIRRYADTDAAFEQAEDELVYLSLDARHKQSDAQGRQLWRTGRPHNLRMVVDTRRLQRERGADLPRVIWVGSGRPPAWCWDGAQ